MSGVSPGESVLVSNGGMQERFPQDCSSCVTFPIAWIKGSVAFSRGFPTGLFYVPQWCESILSVKVEALQGKQVSQEWAETSEHG